MHIVAQAARDAACFRTCAEIEVGASRAFWNRRYGPAATVDAAVEKTLAGRGIAVSPHNPTGPICHAASLQLCAALPGFSMLEMQLDETPLFWSLAEPGLPPVDGGSSAVPAGAGLGVTLDQQAIGELSTVDLRFSA